MQDEATTIDRAVSEPTMQLPQRLFLKPLITKYIVPRKTSPEEFIDPIVDNSKLLQCLQEDAKGAEQERSIPREDWIECFIQVKLPCADYYH